jgi:putative membrane protein
MKKRLFWAVPCLLWPLAACGRWFHRGPDGGWGEMMPFGYGGGMFMGMFFFIILGILVVYLLVRRSKPEGPPDAAGETPLDILKMRYAKGELTRDEYERMKKDLAS